MFCVLQRSRPHSRRWPRADNAACCGVWIGIRRDRSRWLTELRTCCLFSSSWRARGYDYGSNLDHQNRWAYEADYHVGSCILLGLYVLLLLSFAAIWWLTRYTRPRADIAAGGIIAAVIAAYFAIAHRELPSQIAFAVIIGIMVPVLFMEFLNILISASGWGVRAWERRASFRHPVAAMISGLLELSSLLDNKNVIDISARSRCVEIVEEVAQAQKRALVEPLSNVSGHEDAARAQQAERWMAGTVEATRRLKEPILASNTATVTSLRERVEEMLNIVCSEQWKDLPEEFPPSGGKRARAWLSITAQTLVIAILPAAVLLLYQLAIVRLTHHLPHVPTWLPAVAYGIWPVITVLWRLDPDFPAKAGLFGRLGGAPGGTVGDSHQPPSPGHNRCLTGNQAYRRQ